MAKRVPYEEKDSQDENVIVIDNGTGYIKAGWAGDDAPRLVIPSIIADFTSNYSQGIDMVGFEALRHSEEAPLRSPIVRGNIEDMDTMKRIWEYIFKELEVDPAKYPVLVTDRPNSSTQSKRALAEAFFGLKVPGLCIFNQASLSLFAAGRTRGLVIESGEGVTHAVPIFEGFALPHASYHVDVAGLDITNHLLNVLKERGVTFSPAHIEIVRDIKEKLTYLASDSHSAGKETGSSSYELPDGRLIQIPDSVRTEAPEILFKSDETVGGLHKIAFDSITACDQLLQPDLWNNIIVSGGSSNINGFVPRLQSEIAALDIAHAAQNNTQHHNFRICEDLKSQRKHAAWIGGSLFASLPKFSKIKVTRSEYKEDSNMIIKRSF